MDECKALNIEISKKERLKEKIRYLTQLAPGDFAAVRRQNRFRPINNTEIFLERLLEELSVKEGNGDVKMGFL